MKLVRYFSEYPHTEIQKKEVPFRSIGPTGVIKISNKYKLHPEHDYFIHNDEFISKNTLSDFMEFCYDKYRDRNCTFLSNKFLLHDKTISSKFFSYDFSYNSTYEEKVKKIVECLNKIYEQIQVLKLTTIIEVPDTLNGITLIKTGYCNKYPYESEYEYSRNGEKYEVSNVTCSCCGRTEYEKGNEELQKEYNYEAGMFQQKQYNEKIAIMRKNCKEEIKFIMQEGPEEIYNMISNYVEEIK